MEKTFRQIQCIAEDIRLNRYNDDDIRQFKLREIEDICIESIMILSQIRNENN